MTDTTTPKHGTCLTEGYVVRSHADGYEEVDTFSEAVEIAAEWAEDAKDDADAADTATLGTFLTEIAFLALGWTGRWE